jgi:PII-like signaling protein
MALTKLWTTEDVALLLRLEASGATLLRAFAALGRHSSAVTKKANQLGKSFPGVRKVRADLRQSGAIEPLRRNTSAT